MSRRNFESRGRVPKPLDAAALNALALAYLGKYATTRHKLRTYLVRKLRERGWEDENPAPVEAIVERCAELGYVDDAVFAEARGAALTRRGYGEQRVAAALRGAGIDSETSAPVLEAAQDGALDAALAFARRKRIGPFGDEIVDANLRRRHLSQMLRAGHNFDIARLVAFAEQGATLDQR
jgi:regulatory protein